MARLNPLDYRIALITVLEIETQAALLMLDHRHEGEFPLERGDDYVFHAGDINGRNVVIATFPAGSHHGTGVAASLASQTKSYFHNLWFGLLIGVAAGLPNHSKTPAVDIRLGDVLVALPKGESAGLISYDLGKTTDGNFELIDGGRALAKTEAVARSAIGAIKINGPNDRRLFLPFYEAMKDEKHSFKHSVNKTFRDPGQDEDRLYATGPDGVEILVERARRPDDKRTRVWYGPIGSGDKLIKSSAERDRLRDSYNIIGLEMGAAGVMSNLPVGVIRGVCNYGDKHKNKQWQPYAAAMAASYAKAILIKVGEGDEVRVAHSSSNRNITKEKFDVDMVYLAIPNVNIECEILCDLPSQTDQFFGREAQFSMMKQSLQGTDGRKGAVLCGISGSGKTQLARTYISKERDTFSAIIWIDAASPQTIDQSISRCADRIRLRYPQLQQTSVGVSPQMIVLEWLLKRNASRKWLVVIDGMDDLLTSRTLFQSFENVLSDSGAILITSTNPNMARVCRLAQITVEDLDIGSACSLILWRAMGITESDDKKVQQWTRDVAGILNRYALALELAGILISNGIVRMSMPPTIFESKYKQLTSIDPVIWNWAKPHTLFDIFDTLYTNLVAKNRVAGHLLTLCSIYGPQDIPISFLKQLVFEKMDNPALAQEPFEKLQSNFQDELSLNIALLELHEAFLVHKTYAADQSIVGFSVQGAVCQWRIATIGSQRSQWIIQALQGLAGYLALEVDRQRKMHSEGKSREFETFDAFRNFLPMSYRCLQMLENQVPAEQLEAPGGVYARQYYNICSHIAPLISSVGDYELSLKLFSSAVAYLRSTLSSTHGEKHIELLRGMAKCLQRLGRLEETRNTLKDAENLAIYVYGLSSDEAADIYSEPKDVKERIRVEYAHQQSASIVTMGPEVDRSSRTADKSSLTATEQLADTRWETSSEFSTVDPSNCGSTPLHLTSSRGHLTMIELPLEGGANQGLVTKEGETPLLQAAKNNQPSAVSLLLEKDASYVNVTDAKGRTPLSGAAKSGSPEVCGEDIHSTVDRHSISGFGTHVPNHESFCSTV